MKTALVVGGTGMLTEACLSLAKEYDVVGVIARGQKGLSMLTKQAHTIVPVLVDYSNEDALHSALARFVKQYGKPQLVVSWIHSTSSQAPIIVARYTGEDFYDIVGESGKQATHPSREREVAINQLGIQYHRIILGHTKDGWLTNHQISQGVLRAIKVRAAEYVVGD